MATATLQKCSVCSALLNNPKHWTTEKRSPSKPSSGKVTRKVTNNSIEDEYIKQLQKQIFHLEHECHYLRDQLATKSNLINRALIDDHLHQMEKERTELKRTLVETTSKFDQLSSENYGLTLALDELRRRFDQEKQTLLEDLEILRRRKQALEEEHRLREEDLRQNRDRARLSADELKNAQAKIALLEQQLGQHVLQNKTLNDELYQLKLEADDLKRIFHDYQVISREKDRFHTIIVDLQKENEGLRQNLKAQELRHTEIQTLRTKFNDEKATLMKEIARLETLAKDFEREAEQLRMLMGERADALQLKEKELAMLKKKEQSFRTIVDNLEGKLERELLRTRDLEEQIKEFQRQTNIEIQNALLAQREKTDVEVRYQRLQDQYEVVQRDNDHLNSRINALQQRLTDEEKLSSRLRFEIEHLEVRVKEIDRLKELEDLIQSQRWHDITEMAQTMQNVSRTMAHATSPSTTLRKKRVEFE